MVPEDVVGRTEVENEGLLMVRTLPDVFGRHSANKTARSLGHGDTKGDASPLRLVRLTNPRFAERISSLKFANAEA